MKTIKNIFIFVAVAAMSLLLGSCAKQRVEIPAGAMCIDLSTPSSETAKTRAGLQTDAESKVTSARIFFYKENKLLKLLSTGDKGVSVDGSKIVIVDGVISPDNAYNVVVVANWTAGFNAADYIENSARSLLSDALTTITTPIPAPDDKHQLLMSGEITTHNFKTAPTASVNLERQAVKLVVNVKMGDAFKAAYAGAVFGGTAGDVLISVLNVPVSSFVTAPSANAIYPAPVFDYNNLGTLLAADEWTATAYAYENPIMSADAAAKAKATYFILKLPYKLDGGNAVADNYYKFYINDVADAQNPHKTVRNTLYNVSVTITGFGSAVPDINGSQVATTVRPWEGTIAQTDPVGEFLKIKSIKAGTTDLAADPNYKFNRNGETITVELDANVTGTVLEIIDKDNNPVTTKTHDDITTKSILFTLPANFGLEGGTPVEARNYTLRITNSKTKIRYNSTVTNKIEITHRQGAIVWDPKNLGATKIEDGGNIFQFNRNFAFAPTTIATIDAIKGPVSTVTAELAQNQNKFIYRDKIGNIVETPEAQRAWSNDGGGSRWQKGNDNPCANNNRLKRIPTIEDFKVLITIAEPNIIPKNGVLGRYYTISNLDRMFIPNTGYRVWHDQGYSDGVGGFGILWSCTKMTGADMNRGQVFRSESLIIQDYANAVGYSLRCVQYID